MTKGNKGASKIRRSESTKQILRKKRPLQGGKAKGHTKGKIYSKRY